MARKLSFSTLVLTLVVLLAATGAFAVKPPPTGNIAPEVATFDVAAESASPVPVLAFTATDADGTVAGYLITESSTQPDAAAPGWTATAPASYATTSTGLVTLCAWAKDNGGAISASKSDTVNIPLPPINADTLDGMDSTEFAKKYANVIVVAKSGGDFTDPIGAMNSITDASATNPYLLRIMPGIFELGPNTLQMKQYVDIEGSGQKTTTLRGSVGSSSSWPTTGLIHGADNAELRSLTVSNISEGPYVTAVYNYFAPLSISHVTIEASAATGRAYGVVNDSSGATLSDAVISVSGQESIGVFNSRTGQDYGRVRMSHVRISSSGAWSTGIDNYWSVWVNILGCEVSAAGSESSTGISNRLNTHLDMTTSSVTASGPAANVGMGSMDSFVTVGSSVIKANTGTTNTGLSTSLNYMNVVEHSTVEGSSNSLEGYGKVAATRLVGPVAGAWTCVGAYSGEYSALGTACQ